MPVREDTRILQCKHAMQYPARLVILPHAQCTFETILAPAWKTIQMGHKEEGLIATPLRSPDLPLLAHVSWRALFDW
jgi:hypothetical protein